MKIRVSCQRPKYARGEYEFDTLGGLFHWLCRIKGLSQGAPSHYLYGLVKDGSIGIHTARQGLEMECDFHEYALARELGRTSGLTRRGGEVISRDRAKALEFAKAVDKRAKGR